MARGSEPGPWRSVAARWRRALAAATVPFIGAAACGSGGDPPVSDAEVAAAVCDPILEYRNAVAIALQDAQAEVRPGGAAPRDAFLPALRGLHDETIALGERFGALELDRSDPGRRALDDQLEAGVDAAAASWRALIDLFEAIRDPDPESVTSRLATAFVRSEKPIEEVKPEVQDDLGDLDLEAAFHDRASCSFTTVR